MDMISDWLITRNRDEDKLFDGSEMSHERIYSIIPKQNVKWYLEQMEPIREII